MNKKTGMSLFFGGLLPIVVFTLIDEYQGPFWGTVVAMLFGCGEIAYEKFRLGKIEKITLISNFLIFILGIASIATDSGLWFKMQPAIFEAFCALFLWGSLFLKKPLIVSLAEKQGNVFPLEAYSLLKMLTLRLGIFLGIHAALATWAAIAWTTAQWAMLKGIGLTVSFILYMGLEFLYLRKKMLEKKQNNSQAISNEK